jgi:hypothetical protein
MYATDPRARCRLAFAAAGHHSVLELFAGEHRRVLLPGGYTARTNVEALRSTGTSRGDDMFDHGGFIVHSFDQSTGGPPRCRL